MPVSWLTALSLALLALPASAQGVPEAAQDYLGLWLVIDEDDGRPEAVMEIYAEGGAVHGRLVRSLETESGEIRCGDCEGEYAGADLRGVRVLRDLEWSGDGFSEGHVLDPRSGKTYKATLQLEDRDHLLVRGYVGVKALGKTRVLQRADRSRNARAR